MKKIITVLLTLLLVKTNAQQSVGIGTASPDASAVLDINSTGKGMLIPRMTTAQRNAIVSPAKGLLVFDNSYGSYWHYTGNRWKEMGGNSYSADSTLTYGGEPSGSLNMTVNGVILLGNSGYLYDSGGPLGNYGNNEEVMASILPLSNQLAVDITVLSNSLENPYDSIIIRDTYQNYHVLKGNNTGSFRLFGTVTIIFNSNAVNTQQGFSILWKRVLTNTGHQYDDTQLTGWYFNPSKLYMRGGYNLDNLWAPDSSGNSSFAYGEFIKATGQSSTGLGYYNEATGDYSAAVGAFNRSEGLGSVAAGFGTLAANSHAVAMGYYTRATGLGSFAAGGNTVATATHAVALGGHNNALNTGSFVMGSSNTATSPYSTIFGLNNRAKSYGGTVIGHYSDTSDVPSNSIAGSNRLFQIGNGNSNDNRNNAMTVLQNGNIGLGILNPDKNLVVANSIRIDGNNFNNGGAFSNALYFGGESTGEYISVKRTPGGNQYGFDFFLNNQSKVNISNAGNLAVNGNVSVQNGKGIIRGTTTTQQKIQSVILPVNLTINANSTTTLSYNWTETFGASPVAFIGNIAAGSGGGWAEVVLSLTTPSTSGGILYIFNPRNTSASVNFNLVIIGMGAQ